MKTIIWTLASLLVIELANAREVAAQSHSSSHSYDSYELPKRYGIGMDYYQLDQNYVINQLQLSLPSGTIMPNDLAVSNETDYLGLKLDSWLLPYLNVFAIIGEINGTTQVDLSSFNLPQTSINYEGELYGAGVTFAAGYKNLFSSVTLSYSDTSLDGNFQSAISTITLQPKIGLRLDGLDLWLGSTYLSSDESHSGVISLDPNNSALIPFEVELSNKNKTNYGAGVSINMFDPLEFIFDAGFGSRHHVLGNVVYRF